MKQDQEFIYATSSHNHLGWATQYNRMQRWLSRLIELDSNTKGEYSGQNFEDYSIAFFQTCYHLRDYLKQTGVVSKKDLKKLFDESTNLKICRDICNGTKHFSINKPSIDKHFEMGRAYDYFSQDNNKKEIFQVRALDRVYNVMELANNCRNDWNDFLVAHNLIESKDGVSSANKLFNNPKILSFYT